MSEFVTKEEFKGLSESVGKILDFLQKGQSTPVAPPVTKEQKAVEAAKTDEMPVPPSWADAANTIIGEALDHVEVFYPKSGGQQFTVVIKREFSNAPQEYLERHKSDRRTVELDREEFRGFEGVKKWCNLVKQNLEKKRNPQLD